MSLKKLLLGAAFAALAGIPALLVPSWALGDISGEYTDLQMSTALVDQISAATTSRRKTLVDAATGQSKINLAILTGNGETGSLIDGFTIDLVEFVGPYGQKTYAIVNYHIYNDSWNHKSDTHIGVSLTGEGGTLLFEDVAAFGAGRAGCHYPNGLKPHYEIEVNPDAFDVSTGYRLAIPTISGVIGGC